MVVNVSECCSLKMNKTFAVFMHLSDLLKDHKSPFASNVMVASEGMLTNREICLQSHVRKDCFSAMRA